MHTHIHTHGERTMWCAEHLSSSQAWSQNFGSSNRGFISTHHSAAAGRSWLASAPGQGEPQMRWGPSILELGSSHRMRKAESGWDELARPHNITQSAAIPGRKYQKSRLCPTQDGQGQELAFQICVGKCWATREHLSATPRGTLKEFCISRCEFTTEE